MKKILYFMLVGIGLLAACTKGDLVENTVYEKIDLATPKYSYLKILNLTPASPIVNFYMDGIKFSAASSTSGIENTGFQYAGLFPDLGYATTSPGTHTLTAKIISTATADPGLEVFNQQIAPELGKFYTIFTTGIYTTPAKKIPTAIMIEDVKPALDTSKIFVRLANLYNGSSTVEMNKDLATGPKMVSNVAYGTASGWVEVPSPGSGVAPSIKLFVSINGTTPLTTATLTTPLSKGRAYTIFLRGVSGNPTYPLAVTFYTTFY